MSNFRQGKMKPRAKNKPKSQAPTEQDVQNEARSLQELLRLAMLVILSLILLLLLFWAFS